MTHLQAGLSPETLEKARLELNENPDTLHQDIQEVRDMVITRPDIGFLRTDDAFILRFLRARKFHHFEAFRLLAQYFEYRQQNLDMFKSFKATDPGIKQALKDGFPGGLANLDHYGRKILVLFAANWDQSRTYILLASKSRCLIMWRKGEKTETTFSFFFLKKFLKSAHYHHCHNRLSLSR
ncbi:Clvs2 [Phodopus roborovskii]|uniref:Clvs2 protein n=1 Tax=Phodopus roborovskii TaxID=109678 RepID=A0AAU9YS39_PHORO|nr:Clvs2 [Phodopus roborovskii]